MKKYIYVVVACVLMFPAAGIAQVTKFPGYSFEIRINDDKTSNIEVLTGYEFQDLDNGQLKRVLSEYLLMQSPGVGKKPLGPKVSIRPDESLDMQTIVDVIRTARVSQSASVSVATTDGPTIDIPVDPKFLKFQVTKPNPLYLLAVVDEKKKITLNNEDLGSLSDPSRLIARLKQIFHDREINGVTRENSLDVEKTVNIRLGPTAKFKDLSEVATILESAGSDRLVLLIDKDQVLEVQRSR